MLNQANGCVFYFCLIGEKNKQQEANSTFKEESLNKRKWLVRSSGDMSNKE